MRKSHSVVLGVRELSALDLFPGAIREVSFSCVSSHSIAKFTLFYPSSPAVVGRPCELKALHALPGNRRGLTLSLDCFGTVAPAKVREIAQEAGIPLGEVSSVSLQPGSLVFSTREGEAMVKLRPGYLRASCRRCLLINSEPGDISLGLYGDTVLLKGASGRGWAFLEKAGLERATREEEALRAKALREASAERAANRRREFSLLEAREDKLEYWSHEFSKCIKCYGCRDACPLCVCRGCSIEDYYSPRGAVPPGMFSFHLPWLSHVLEGCVNCGQCDDACPAGIPLSRLVQFLQERVAAGGRA